MENKRGNIFLLPDVVNSLDALEYMEELLIGKEFKLEKIISKGAVSPPGFWYDQKQDEWVLLLEGEAELLFLNGDRVKMQKGDYILIPKGVKHRVEKTSISPPCIWLCLFVD